MMMMMIVNGIPYILTLYALYVKFTLEQATQA